MFQCACAHRLCVMCMRAHKCVWALWFGLWMFLKVPLSTLIYTPIEYLFNEYTSHSLTTTTPIEWSWTKKQKWKHTTRQRQRRKREQKQKKKKRIRRKCSDCYAKRAFFYLVVCFNYKFFFVYFLCVSTSNSFFLLSLLIEVIDNSDAFQDYFSVRVKWGCTGDKHLNDVNPWNSN